MRVYNTTTGPTGPQKGHRMYLSIRIKASSFPQLMAYLADITASVKRGDAEYRAIDTGDTSETYAFAQFDGGAE
jgi:hypothetical protein